jgi:hypothetical protein
MEEAKKLKWKKSGQWSLEKSPKFVGRPGGSALQSTPRSYWFVNVEADLCLFLSVSLGSKTAAQKNRKAHSALPKDLKISHKKSGVGNRYHLYSYGKRVYVFNCDYWFAYKICFELERKQHNECRLCADILQETIQSMVSEILIHRSRKSIHQWGSHQCIIKQWNKISMDGKGRAIDNIFYWKIMEDSQIRECIFTSIYWRNQPLQRT